ncbi:FtsX-like permease family protein [Staphylococcus chromogenes]|nr:FtsX-like permease family protein [Staphylococcus chromogenes]
MIRLALAQLRRRAHRYLALFFAIFAAVALTVGTAAIVESLQKTVNGMFDKPYDQAQYVAQVRSSNPEELAPVLERPGYVFDQQVSASIRPAEQAGELYTSTFIRGVQDGALQWRDLREGKLPQGDGEIAVVDETPLGTNLVLKVPGRHEEVPVTVVGRMEQSAQEQLIGSKSVLADAPALRGWAGDTASGELRIASPENLTQVKQQLPANSVTELKPTQQHTAALARKYLNGRDQYFLLLSAFMVIVAVVAGLVIFSSYSVLAAERRREFALLRAVGASSGQIQGATMVESLVLAAVAGGLAIPAGLWAAAWAGQHADKLGIRVPLNDVHLQPSWLLVIFVAGMLASVISALPAASGAARKPLVESLTASAPKNSKVAGALSLLLGIAMLAGGVYALDFAGTLKARRALVAAIGGAGLIVLGTIAVLAIILPWFIFQLSRLASALPTLQLGMAFVGRQRLRAGSLVAIVIAGTALVSAVLHGQSQLETHLLSKATNKGAVDVMVRALDNTAEPQLEEQLKAVDGVEAVVAPVALPMEAEGVRDNVLALSAADGQPVLRGPITGAGPGEIVLGANSPLRNKLPDGKSATLSVRGQEHQLKVRYNEGLESFVDPAVTPEVPVVNRPGIDTRLPKPFVLVKVRGGYAQPADSPIVESIRKAAAGSGEQVSFQEAFSARENVAETASRILSLSTLMSLVALLIAGVGVLNTVTLMVRERARDFALLSAVGLTRLGRLCVQVVELLFLVLPAAIVGAAVGGLLGTRIAGVLTGLHISQDVSQQLIDVLAHGHTPLVTATAVGIALLAGMWGSLKRG